MSYLNWLNETLEGGIYDTQKINLTYLHEKQINKQKA